MLAGRDLLHFWLRQTLLHDVRHRFDVRERRQDRLYRHEGHCVQRESRCLPFFSLNEMCELYDVVDSARHSRSKRK